MGDWYNVSLYRHPTALVGKKGGGDLPIETKKVEAGRN